MLERGDVLTGDSVTRSLAMLRSGEVERPADVLTLNILSSRGRTIRPKTLNQKRYVDAIDAHTIVFGIGPAGTGKTYLAMAKAVQSLQAKQVNRIILTRPAVEAGERLGFLPGTLYEKIDPYLRPLYDALHDMIDPDSIPRLMQAGTIEVAPLAYMRGRTLNDAFIILDEAQNTSAEQMKMFLTRLGFGSRIVVTGDVTQIDLPSGTTSGLRVVQEILDGVEDVHFAQLTSGDVVRHRLVSDIVDAYARYDAARAPATSDDGAAGTPMSVYIANESGVEIDEVRLAQLARHVLDQMGVAPLAELSVMLVDTTAMERLHVQYMGEEGPTDVLAFPQDDLSAAGAREDPRDEPGRAARRRRAVPAGRREAGRGAGHGTEDELHLLCTHGILHLLGYDHGDPAQEREMFGVQARLLASWRAAVTP